VADPLILVVDDNAALRYAWSRTLRLNGFTVVEAETGADALSLAVSHQPDLVLLDVNLPDIHGFDVARQLKQLERTRTIPILQISASFVRMEHRVEGLAAGADAYLVEPVEPGELIANIRALLRLRDAEAGLRRTTAMFAAVVDASAVATIVFDDTGVVQTWNRAAERLFGYTATEIVGNAAGANGLDLIALDRLAHDLRAGVGPGGVEHLARRKDGSGIEVSIFAAPLESHASPGFVAIIEDISARTRFERERSELLARERDARREAEAANRLKDEFLATLSHELRTPLNAIMGWASMLRSGALDADGAARAVETIERNARSQQQLIGDILQVSQIIRGRLRLDLQSVDLAAVVTAAVESVRPAIEAKELTLTVRNSTGPVMIAGDRERLQQIFWNLLSNAVKYTPRNGRVDVDVLVRDSDTRVTIRDSGIGIAPDMLPHVFERFRQGDMKPTRDYGGLGLGLAIVRHLTEAHGGSVHAESTGDGRGAAFTVTLPIAGKGEGP